MARPKKEKDSIVHITLRLTDTEYELITSRANEIGISRSDYIRKQLLDGKIIMKYEIVTDMPELQKLVTEFGRIGNNLNQIARFFNIGGVRSKLCRMKSMNVFIRFLKCEKKYLN